MKKISIILFILVIFSFSFHPSEISLALSGRVLDILPFDSDRAHFYIRKSAHFINFAILSIILSFYFEKKEGRLMNKAFKILSISFLVAIADESIQYFLTDRTGSIRDIVIDFAGACFGLFLFCLRVIIKGRDENAKK